MNKKETSHFRKAILNWYRINKRDLPWRETTDPYKIWVSEVMLQQTQVNTVIDYYRRFIRQFPDIASLADATLEDVLKQWEGLGYYSRARNLHKAVKQLIETGLTRVPDTPEDFLQLTGVGNYTCAAVQSIAFNHPLAVVDGNVKRVLARLFELAIPVNDSSVHTEFNQKAMSLIDPLQPSDFNQAMMELGALLCRPKAPQCSLCPVSEFCLSFKHQSTDLFPKRKKKKPVPTRHHAAGAVFHNGLLLITRRKSNGFLGGLWEFPGGRLKKRESPEAAVKREVALTTGIAINEASAVTRVKHTYTHFKLVLDLFLCSCSDPTVTLNGPEAYHWMAWPELDTLAFHKAVHKCFPALKKMTA